MVKKKDTEELASQGDIKEQAAMDSASDEPEEDPYSMFDEEVAEILRADDRYLEEFYASMRRSGLSDNTIGNHMSNAELFVRDWLGAREGCPMEEGPDYVGGFLGNYYIRRCMWSTPLNIKTTATSIKKFYKCMADLGHISQATYKGLVETIKQDTPEWQWKCAVYNDPVSEWEEIADLFEELW